MHPYKDREGPLTWTTLIKFYAARSTCQMQC